MVKFKFLNILKIIYVRLYSVFHYKQNKNEKEAKEQAYVTLRNMLGVVILLLLILLFPICKCVFNLKVKSLGVFRLQLYVVFGILIFSYLLISKKILKPIFENVLIPSFSEKELKKNSIFYILLIVTLSLAGGGVYVVGKLISIYCK